uniref:Uncharacterized protein n=1 Tax=Triticum urartu TaxID=4572 RepID=A0A8R7U419_TRIUA
MSLPSPFIPDVPPRGRTSTCRGDPIVLQVNCASRGRSSPLEPLHHPTSQHSGRSPLPNPAVQQCSTRRFSASTPPNPMKKQLAEVRSAVARPFSDAKQGRSLDQGHPVDPLFSARCSASHHASPPLVACCHCRGRRDPPAHLLSPPVAAFEVQPD